MSTDTERRDGYAKERELKADGRYIIYYTFSDAAGMPKPPSEAELAAGGAQSAKAEEGADV